MELHSEELLVDSFDGKSVLLLLEEQPLLCSTVDSRMKWLVEDHSMESSDYSRLMGTNSLVEDVGDCSWELVEVGEEVGWRMEEQSVEQVGDGLLEARGLGSRYAGMDVSRSLMSLGLESPVGPMPPISSYGFQIRESWVYLS